MLGREGPWSEIYTSVGQCIHAWSNVEIDLATLFVALHDRPVKDPHDRLRAVFEAVISFEVRLAMIQATVAADPQYADYAPQFNTLKNKLAKSYKQRHQVAHFVSVGRSRGETTTHTIRPFFTMAAFRAGPEGELTNAQVEQLTENFFKLSQRVGKHAQYIRLRKGIVVSDHERSIDPARLLET